ncbi:hypothetical protein KAR91_38085 [Candidatus Pacearchaeota archaeon]|nr:hypothetical protein [Candidatus Pacearchaeota archaeon]
MNQQTADDLLLIERIIDVTKQYGCEITAFNIEEFNFDIIGPSPEKEEECVQALSECINILNVRELSPRDSTG